MTTRFVFLKFQNPDNVDYINRILKPLMCLIPPWVSLITFIEGTDDGNLMSITTEQKYRRIQITTGKDYWLASHEERFDALRHELAHIYTSPPVEAFFERIMGEIELPPGIRDAVKGLIADILEGCTEDLQQTFARLMP